MVTRVSIAKLFICLVAFGVWGQAQSIKPNMYGLRVVNQVSVYKNLVETDSMAKMVNLAEFLPGITLDIRYATTNNFSKKKLYPRAMAFARLNVALALQKIRTELAQENLDIKIYDAYRPYDITCEMWEYVLDDRYAATPNKGSRHNRGCAVDLTLISTIDGKELPMPTPYDSFSVKAHDTYNNLPAEVKKNRKRLRDVMEKYGFTHLTSEWWHFDFKNWNKCPLLDLSFDILETVN